MQCYLLLTIKLQSNNQPLVLIAKKKYTGSRFNFSPISPPQPLNYAGQWVIPGGKRHADQQNRFLETIQEAAFREFYEETGLLLIIKGQYACTYYHEFILSIRTKQESDNYSVTYVEIVESPEVIQGLITAHITEALTADDELEDVEWVTPEAAKNSFNHVLDVPQQYKRFAEQRRDWFVTAINQIP